MTFVLKPEMAQTHDETQPHIQFCTQKNASSLDILPAHGRLKELCEQFEKDASTTVAITDTCTIEISSLSSIQPLLRSNEVVFQKEAA